MITKEERIKCKETAKFRFTWPGEKERKVCARHAHQLSKIAEAMGFNLQFIVIHEDDREYFFRCSQTEPKEKK